MAFIGRLARVNASAFVIASGAERSNPGRLTLALDGRGPAGLAMTMKVRPPSPPLRRPRAGGGPACGARHRARKRDPRLRGDDEAGVAEMRDGGTVRQSRRRALSVRVAPLDMVGVHFGRKGEVGTRVALACLDFARHERDVGRTGRGGLDGAGDGLPGSPPRCD